MRASGLPGVVFEDHDHVCAFYRGSEERDAILRRFYAAGLAAGEKCLCSADTTDVGGVARMLGGEGPKLTRPDQLTVVDSQGYLTDGRFEPRLTFEHWDQLFDSFYEAGYSHVRGTGELSWFPRGDHPVGSLFEYERMLNEFTARKSSTVLCLYDLDVFGGRLVGDLIRRHPATLARGMLFRGLDPVAPRRRGTAAALRHDVLVLANLLLAGAADDGEVGDLVASVAHGFLAPDLAAVLWCRSGRGVAAHGRVGDGEVGPPEIALLAAAVAELDDSGSGTTGALPGYPSASFHPIRHGGEDLGWLVTARRQPSPTSAPGGMEDGFAVLNGLALGAGVHAVAARAKATPAAALSELTGDLVDGALGDDDPTRAQLQAAGFDPGRRHRTVVVRSTPGGAARDPRAELAAHGIRLSVRRGGDLIFVTPDDASWPDLVAALAELAPEHVIGIGSAGLGPDAARRSHAEARQAVDLARHTGRSTVRFDDLSVLRVLAAGGNVEAVESFAREMLGPLLDSHRARDTELLRTLSVFLDQGANQQATAAALRIHISTLRYRLTSLSAMTGRNLADPETRFQLQLAFRAWECLEVLRPAAGTAT